MDPNVREWLNMIFRWAHVVAGILWIGHLYFFNSDGARLTPGLLESCCWGWSFTWMLG